MDEFNILIPQGYEGNFEKVWKDHDSWDNVSRNQVDVSDLFDNHDDDEEENIVRSRGRRRHFLWCPEFQRRQCVFARSCLNRWRQRRG